MPTVNNAHTEINNEMPQRIARNLQRSDGNSTKTNDNKL